MRWRKRWRKRWEKRWGKRWEKGCETLWEKRCEKLWKARCEKLWNHELFKSYRAKFAADAKRILKKKKLTKKYTREMQAEELERYILTATRALEQEKLYYYLLAKSNEQPVLIIKSPTDTEDRKRFLGYEWSSRKGGEGIKYIGSATKSKEDEDEDEDEELLQNPDSTLQSSRPQ